MNNLALTLNAVSERCDDLVRGVGSGDESMNDLGRNDQCWCGSGKKYKKCHLHRGQQEMENPWDAVAANKSAFHAKKCYAQDTGLGPCEGKIVKAHTVSRGPNLTKIARQGKVIRYRAELAELKKTGGKLTAAEIGIGDASVFFGFCAGHDRNLFSCIENEAFTGRVDQCLAVAYRTLSREYYGKNAASHLRETLRNADKGKSRIEQFHLQRLLAVIDHSNEAAKKELENTHSKLTQALVDRRDSPLRSMVLEFDGNLPFMFAGAWSPFTDLFGSNVQDGYTDEMLEQIFVSSFGGDVQSHICISWVDQANAPGQVIAHQIRELLPSNLAAIILQFVVKHVENIFFDPAWFEALTPAQLKQLDNLAASGVDIAGSVPTAPINLKLGLNLPVLTRIFDVGGEDRNG